MAHGPHDKGLVKRGEVARRLISEGEDAFRMLAAVVWPGRDWEEGDGWVTGPAATELALRAGRLRLAPHASSRSPTRRQLASSGSSPPTSSMKRSASSRPGVYSVSAFTSQYPDMPARSTTTRSIKLRRRPKNSTSR